jgi:hypothetical protein
LRIGSLHAVGIGSTVMGKENRLKNRKKVFWDRNSPGIAQLKIINILT